VTDRLPSILSVILTGMIRMESRVADTVADGLGPGVARGN